MQEIADQEGSEQELLEQEAVEEEYTPEQEQTLFTLRTWMNEPTMGDYYRFHLRYCSKSFYVFKLLGVAFLVSAVFYPLYAVNGVSIFQMLILLFESGLFLFSTTLFTKLQLAAYRKNHTTGGEELNLAFHELRMSWQNARGSGYVYYGEFIHVYETRGYFYLYLSKQTSYIAAKAELSIAQTDELRAFLTERIGQPVSWCGPKK